MLDVKYSTKSKKDVKTCDKRNYNMQLLIDILDTLRIPEQLPDKTKTIVKKAITLLIEDVIYYRIGY